MSSSSSSTFSSDAEQKSGQPNKRKQSTDNQAVPKKQKHINHNTCVVCMNELGDLDGDNVCVLNCAHAFHSTCIQVAFVEKKECPMCRNKNIGCQHGNASHDHNRETLIVVNEALTQNLADSKREVQELKDTITAIAVRLQEENAERHRREELQNNSVIFAAAQCAMILQMMTRMHSN